MDERYKLDDITLKYLLNMCGMTRLGTEEQGRKAQS